MASTNPRIVVYQIGDNIFWTYTVKSTNGATVAVSNRLYKAKSSAVRAARSLASLITGTTNVEIDVDDTPGHIRT